MSEITIVTAFYDIGRTNWKAYPRSTEEYMQRFKWLCKLDNDIIVYTSSDLVKDIENIVKGRSGKTTICAYDALKNHKSLNRKISMIQNNSAYKSRVNPYQSHSPEYWNPEYVLVNLLKPTFVNMAINSGLVQTDMVAWVDFGYCRTPEDIGVYPRWNYNFDDSKIHLFSIREVSPDTNITSAIFNNEVYTIGTYYVAHTSMWPTMKSMMDDTIRSYIELGVMDDDQSIMLASVINNPELFEIHNIHPSNWFVLFTQFNQSMSQ